MQQPTHLQFLTPSYRGDLDRFILLRRTVERFARCRVEHVAAVPRQDVSLFRDALRQDTGVRVVAQQDYVAPMFYAPAWSKFLQEKLGRRAWRLTQTRFGGRPGWIVQQIVKLSAPELFAEGAVCIVDSDLLFVREFDVSDLLPASGTRVLMRLEPEKEPAKHRNYMRKSRELLKLAPNGEDHHFMAYPAIWYTDWVQQLRDELERRHGKPWQQVLYDSGFFSEYLLYGVYLDEVLIPPGLEQRKAPLHVGVWDREGFDRFMRSPRQILDSYPAGKAPLTLVVQSNIGMAPQSYANTIEAALLNPPADADGPRHAPPSGHATATTTS